MDDLAHFLAFDARRLSLLSTRVVPFTAGVAYFDEGYPERYVSNLLVIDRDQASVDELVGWAESILGGAGLSHRFLKVMDEHLGERLRPGFHELGYEVHGTTVMSLRRPPDRPAALIVEERSFDEARPLTEEIYRREHPSDPELARRFLQQHASWDRALGARRFVALLDGAPAGQCELYLMGAHAQIEFVDTLEEYRGRGVARAVVLAAVAAARGAGAHRVFIAADSDDWPRLLYERLGFDPIGGYLEFSRRLNQLSPTSVRITRSR